MILDISFYCFLRPFSNLKNIQNTNVEKFKNLYFPICKPNLGISCTLHLRNPSLKLSFQVFPESSLISTKARDGVPPGPTCGQQHREITWTLSQTLMCPRLVLLVLLLSLLPQPSASTA